MSRVKKLTIRDLSRLINEEKKALASKKAKEVNADQYADQLEKHINFMSALKIKESKLRRELKKVRDLREAARRRAAKLVK